MGVTLIDQVCQIRTVRALRVLILAQSDSGDGILEASIRFGFEHLSLNVVSDRW